MKKIKLIVVLTHLLIGTFVFAQAPEKTSYQAVIRDAANGLVTNQAVGMKISILQGSASGTVVYAETQTPTSNINGLVSLEIGAGTVVTGTFAAIDWANGPFFIKTETDPTGGTSYTITGTSQLASTPYSLHAKTAKNGVPTGGTANQVLVKVDGTDYNTQWATPAAGGASELEKITQSGNTGWRMLGATPANYGTIGNNAKDLSFSDDNTGVMGARNSASFASGYNTKALGASSTAMGEGTNASGYVSTAIGSYTTASGIGSTALGGYTTASGRISTAMGSQSTASGENSTAMGSITTASGYSSTAMGVITTAKSATELVIGQFNDVAASPTGASWTGTAADRVLTVGIGSNSSNKKSALVILQNGNTGIGTSTPTSLLHVKGAVRIEDGTQAAGKVLTSDANGLATWATPATGGASQLELLTQGANTGWRMLGATPANYGNIGQGAKDLSYSDDATATLGATGSYSFASGNNTKASGLSSTAMGFWSLASGTFSTAMGNSIASGYASTAMGKNTTASGDYSTAMGVGTTASANRSTAMGNQTTAKSFTETVLGQFNDEAASPTSASWSGTAADRILTVGNGADLNNKKSALVILQNGNTGIGTSTPTNLLHLNSATSGALKIVDGTQAAGKVLTSDANGVATWATPAAGGASQLELLPTGGWRMLGATPANYGAIGYKAVDFSYSNFNTGINGATALYSFATGLNTLASGNRSTAMGYSTIASGFDSTAIGQSTSATGSYSTAMNLNTIASGAGSTAMGNSSTASGSSSIAMGNGTTASGVSSIAMGNVTTAYGNASIAMGDHTVARSYGETVVGQYNDDLLTPNMASWMGDASNRVFAVGTGVNASIKRTSFSVLQDGTVKIGPNGSNIKNVYTATAALGSSSTQKKVFTITHNKGFIGSQSIVASVQNEPTSPYTDAFSVTIANINGNSFQAVVYRLDGTDWGQTPQLNYTIIEQN